MANNEIIIINTNTTSIKNKAIAIAIRHHLSEVEDDEVELYESMCNDGELEWFAWQPFENYEKDELLSSIDGLIDDIINTLS